MKKILYLTAALLCAVSAAAVAAEAEPVIARQTVAQTVAALKEKFPDQADRIAKGVNQVARVWTAGDGSAADFSAFCAANFLAGAELDATFDNIESQFEYIDGYFRAMWTKTHHALDVNTGPLRPEDRIFASYAPSAHLQDDMFATKLAFLVLLNFPVRTLEEAEEKGASWSRAQWAQARLTKLFAYRVPAEVSRKITQALTAAEEYISGYNIYMDHVVGSDGKPAFAPGLLLQSHWGLRDELKGMYADPGRLAGQKLIYTIMQRIINQEIPAGVINSSQAFWNPETNTVNGEPAAREPDTRYQTWLNVFQAYQLENPYYPEYPTHRARIFSIDREIPEARAQVLFEELLDLKAAAEVGALIKGRLGRELLPFDIWYDGFKARSAISQDKLDALCRDRYPTIEAFHRDIPSLLRKLGFEAEKSEFLASRIEVENCRGGGHAEQADMRGEKAHLCVRFNADGLDYQGFNTAMHELGHTVEQTVSLYDMDHHFLRGVPNSAFSEDFAFIFQDRDMYELGLQNTGGKTEALKTLDSYWSAREIAGVALVDMQAWRWLDGHPDATAGQFRQAVVTIAKEVWNKYYAPVFGVKDSPILAVYSHMINYALYIPDYPLGHIVAYQLEDYFKTHPLAPEMLRMCRIGSVIPQEWMKQAVGAGVSARPLVNGALKALKEI
ncbi:MAG: hypothetical protein PHW69_05440 [Elusimicrobiaceae bacterium]|nr:hypothetical protein [Elusimicrobiaceae bacterium]